MGTKTKRLYHRRTLIVIVVVGVLAAITAVAYNGVQQRGRDTQRKSDIAAITKALELYYIDKGEYPEGNDATVLGDSWSTTADASWQNLAVALRPYMSNLPSDPISTPGVAVISEGYNYAYFANRSSGITYCGASQNQMYIILYRLEGAEQVNDLRGNCPEDQDPLGPYENVSNYRMSKS